MVGGGGASQACIYSLTPLFCRFLSAAASTNEVTPILGNLSIAATRATNNEAILTNFDVSDGDEQCQRGR